MCKTLHPTIRYMVLQDTRSPGSMTYGVLDLWCQLEVAHMDAVEQLRASSCRPASYSSCWRLMPCIVALCLHATVNYTLIEVYIHGDRDPFPVLVVLLRVVSTMLSCHSEPQGCTVCSAVTPDTTPEAS